ncbi:MAG TPA: DUF748 domain-containing protein, partial [Candidatus Methylomirabilis sp.]|nr:DUF748 domain-containing protein [Candidatus Methylomirabilis sp.]
PFADSHETTLDVNITDLDLPYYLAYVPRELLTFALPSGRVDAKLDITFVEQRAGGQTLTVKGDIGLRDLVVVDKQGGPVVRIPTLGLGLASVEPFVRKVHLVKVILQSPELTVRREKTGITNLETLLPKPTPAKQSDAKAPEPASEGLTLDVDELSIAGAKVLFSDLFNRAPFQTTLDPIDAKALQLSTRPDTKGSFTLSVKTEGKEEFAVEGEMSLTPLTVEGKVEGKSVLLKKYAPYYSDVVRFDIESGALDFSSRYKFAEGKGEPEIVAAEASATLDALRAKRRDEKGDFLRIPSLSVTDVSADITQRQIIIGSLASQKGTLSAKRLSTGELNLQQLIAPPPAGEGQGAGTPAAKAERPWVITLKRLALDQYAVQLEDQAASEPITLNAEKIRLSAEDISTAKNTTGKIRLA